MATEKCKIDKLLEPKRILYGNLVQINPDLLTENEKAMKDLLAKDEQIIKYLDYNLHKALL
jgi:hypothetical protein